MDAPQAFAMAAISMWRSRRVPRSSPVWELGVVAFTLTSDDQDIAPVPAGGRCGTAEGGLAPDCSRAVQSSRSPGAVRRLRPCRAYVAATAGRSPGVQSKVPVLNKVGGTESWYKPQRSGLFGTQTLYKVQAAVIAAWAVQAEPVAKKLDPSVEVDRLPVKYQTTDYTPVISKVKAAKIQAVVLILTSPEAAAFLKETKLLGLSLPTYAYAPVESAVALAKDAAEGLKAVQLVKASSGNDPAVKEFGTAMAKAIIAAYEKASSADPGVSPVMKFSASDHLGARSVQRVVVKNGVWTSVGDFCTPPARD